MEDVKMKVCEANEMRKVAEKPSKVLNRLYNFILSKKFLKKFVKTLDN